MTPPYRSNTNKKSARRPRDTGIVGDIIDQFSDKLAFFRELVQNSIDAETEAIEVEIRYEESIKSALVSVSDRGLGMSRDTIENQLVVLFRSTKEKEDDKIGKFGIGFVSVLAVKPALVRVISSHGGVRHTLHLYPDLSFELFESGRATSTSTQVVLEIPMEAAAVQAFAKASSEALHRWCRHAQVMITLEAWGGGSKPLLSERIDRPLAVEDAIISVKGESRDGKISAVVGIPMAGNRRCSFFNHGLLLYETSEHMLRELSFVVQDARLGHTLSRDNVRRDKNYERCLDFVRDLAAEQLPDRCAEELRHALEEEDFAIYRFRARSVYNAKVQLAPMQWSVPVLGDAGNTVASADEVSRSGSWATRSGSALGEALMRSGVRVLNYGEANLGKHSNKSPHWLLAIIPNLRFAEDELTLATPELLEPSDLILIDKLAEILDRSYRPPSQIHLAILDGAGADRLYVSGGSTFLKRNEGHAWVLEASEQSSPFRPFLRPSLILNAGLAHVAAARRKAVTEPALAAELLAREILLKNEKLDVPRSEALFTDALSRHLGGWNKRENS